jgi:hypothetical protein
MEAHSDRAADQGKESVLDSWEYSVWAYDRGDKDVPILIVCFEWHMREMHALRSEGAWLHEEEDNTGEWSTYPEYALLQVGVNAEILASLVAQGKLQRVGSLPLIGRYAVPPAWLK